LQFVENEFSSTYEEKKSKFIAHLVPYEKFDTLMARLKQEHPKGRHFVYAYRHLNDFDQVVENCSDDGEPKGTSGKPSLNVLRGNDIINCAVIIVRYFGGIKLGTGGLVRAYGDAVNQVLNEAQLMTYKKLTHKKLTISYDQLGQIEYLLNNNISIINKEFTSDIILTLSATQEDFEIIHNQLPVNTDLI
jgi:uncharacterized YigZ family protein